MIILPLTAVSAIVYIVRGTVDWLPTLWVTIGVVAGGIVGALLLSKLKSNVAKIIFALVLIAGGIKMFFNILSRIVRLCVKRRTYENIFTYFIRFLSGIIGGMGMGGGTLLVPLLSFMDLEQKTIQAINLISFLPMCCIALGVHAKNKLIKPTEYCGLLCRAIALAVVGALALR